MKNSNRMLAWNTLFKRIILCFGVLLLVGTVSIAEEESSDSNRLPDFIRDTPISSDDPAGETVRLDEKIEYQYGKVYENVNGYFILDEQTQIWKGIAPHEDHGVIIGGNAASGHDEIQEDNDSNSFNGILPDCDIYINPNRLTYQNGVMEFTFYSKLFHYNSTNSIDSSRISIHGNSSQLTNYRRLIPSKSNPGLISPERAQDWRGIVYSGGIAKTTLTPSGEMNATVVRNDDENGESKLFSIRYKNAAMDRNGDYYDLVLTFTQITFVAENAVKGPLAIMEENKLMASPTLWNGSEYLIEGDVNDPDGVKIGAIFEFDYSIENERGKNAIGELMFSVDDLDQASVATALRSNANWGTNDLGYDFRFAEGFAIKDGAITYAVVPYFNHVLKDASEVAINNGNGDTTPVRISRLPGTEDDGTCNGLLFTTSITSVSGDGTRNDDNTLDTGFSTILNTKGSMLASLSSGRTGDAMITLFDSAATYRIQKGNNSGGTVVAVETLDGYTVENPSVVQVVGGGTSVKYAIMPDDDYAIYSIRIDEKKIRFSRLRWRRVISSLPTAEYTIEEQYGKWATTTKYTFTREDNGRVVFNFDDIQDSHEIYVEFLPISQIPNDLEVNTAIVGHRRIRTTQKIAVFMIAALAALVIAATVLWLKGDGKRE